MGNIYNININEAKNNNECNNKSNLSFDPKIILEPEFVNKVEVTNKMFTEMIDEIEKYYCIDENSDLSNLIKRMIRIRYEFLDDYNKFKNWYDRQQLKKS